MTDAVQPNAGGKVDAENPWPGPEAFGREDAQYFFGRDRAREALTRLVLQNRLVLLYGRSGLGKTSLLRAGVFPKLEEALTLPIYVRLRFGASLQSGVAPDLQHQLKAAIDAAVARARGDGPDLDPSATLWEWFYRTNAQFFNERSRRVRPVLVFDQFEEAFTHGRATPELVAATDRFIDQLIDLIRGSVPASVAARFEQDASRTLDYVTDRDACGVLLAVRREFLAELLRLRPRLPALLDHRFELSGMTLEDAESVVVGAGAQLIEPGVERAIARFVAAARRNVEDQSNDDTTVDPAILSIFCRELNNTRRERKLPRITANLVAGVQAEIIADFYRRSVADQPPDVRRFVEEQLVTPSGYRNSVAWDQAIRDPDIEKAIEPLVDRRLIRVEGVPPLARIELTHDVLTEPIGQSRNVRRVQEIDEKRRKTRTKYIALVALVIATIAGGIFSLVTYRAQRAAEKAQRAAEQAGREAVRNLSFAHFEQGQGLMTVGRAGRGLAYVAQAIRDDAENATARSFALDAVLHANWALPDAVFKHKAGVLHAAFGAGDTVLLTIAADGLAHEWKMDTVPRVEGRRFHHDGAAVTAAAIRRTDNLVATAAADGTLRIWTTDNPPPIEAHHNPPPIKAHGNPPPNKVLEDTAVLDLDFDAAGQRLVTASADGTAVLWNVADGQRVMTLSGHNGAVQTAQFSPDGQSVVTASADHKAIVWDVRAKQPRVRFRLSHDATIRTARFTRDGTKIITASDDRSARVWDARTGDPIGGPLTHDTPLVSADFSPDGLRIVTVTAGEVAIWTDRGALALEPIPFDTGVTGAAFTADGRRLLTTSPDGAATLWDVRGGAAVPVGVRAACLEAILKFRRDANQVAVGCPDMGTIDLWDLSTNRMQAITPSPSWVGLAALDFSDPQGRVLARNGGQVVLSRIGVQGATTLSHGTHINEATLSPDGRLVATAGHDGTKVWDAQTGAAVAHVATGTDSWAVRFTDDSMRIVTASNNGFAEIWNARSGARAGPAFAAVKDVATVKDVPLDARLDAGGRWLALSTQATATTPATVTVFDALSGKTIKALDVTGVESQRVRVLFSPAGDTLVTVTAIVQLWDPLTGHLVATLREPSAASDAQFSADGRLVTIHAGGFRLWDPRTGQPQSRLVPAREYGGFAAVALEGQRAVAVGRDGVLRRWDFPLGTREDGRWIGPLLEFMVGYRSNERAAIEPIEDWSDALQTMRGQVAPGTIAAWTLADRDGRPVSPFTNVTRDEYIQAQLDNGSDDARREAQRLFPWVPRVRDWGVIR